MNVFRPSVLFAALASISFVTAQGPVTGSGKVETKAPAAEAEWMQNFAEAKAKAAKEGKNLLVDFTGSDWCVWCKRLDKEVFAEADFQKEIVKGYVLVKLDFPQDQSLVTEEIKAQNAQLQEQYKVQGFPTVFLMDANGKPFAQTGYQAGGGAKYLEHVAEISKGKAAYDEHMAKAKDAKGIELAKHITAALEALNNDEMIFAHYRTEIDRVMELDADGKAGLKAKFEAKIAKSDLEAKFNELAQGGDWDAVDKAMAEALEKWKGNKDIEQMATFYRAIVLIEGKQDFAGALKLVDAAREIAPESEMGKRLVQIKKNIERIQKQMEQQGGGEEGGKDGGK